MSSTRSATGFENATKILDTLADVNEFTKLLPDSVCFDVAERIEAELRPITTPTTAQALMRKLLGQYPDLKVHDPKVYAVAVTEIFAAYPEAVGRRICDNVNGLAVKQRFTPKTAQIKEALDAEVKRLRNIRANALWHVSERKRRLKQAADDAKYPASEERKAAVARILARALKPMTLD